MTLEQSTGLRASRPASPDRPIDVADQLWTDQQRDSFTNVGILLGVTPRISPDGLVVMEIDAEKSELSGDGVPISISRRRRRCCEQPIIDTTRAQTTVSARSGQTVILGGLITKTRSTSSSSVPYLGDIPVLGSLFRFDSVVR